MNYMVHKRKNIRKDLSHFICSIFNSVGIKQRRLCCLDGRKVLKQPILYLRFIHSEWTGRTGERDPGGSLK